MAVRDTTINMRVVPERKDRLQIAADLEQTSLSRFVLSAAEEKAERVIAAHSTTVVSAEFFDALTASLAAPAKANKALAAAAAKPSPVVRR